MMKTESKIKSAKPHRIRIQSALLYLSSFVGSEGALGGLLALGAGLELSEVAMVISLHLEIEDLGVAGEGRGDEARVEQLENTITDVGELSLDLGSVLADHGDVVVVAAALLLLLDRGDDAPGGTASSDHVLVSDREKVALLDGEFFLVGGGGDLLNELHHLLVALGLLGELRHVDVLFARRGCGHCW